MRDLKVHAERKLKNSSERHQSYDKMLRCDWLDAVDLSKTSCSQTALNGFVLDMSGSGKTRRICVQHLDASKCCRQIRVWSLRADLS